jgi:hypothetical protein
MKMNNLLPKTKPLCEMKVMPSIVQLLYWHVKTFSIYLVSTLHSVKFHWGFWKWKFLL